MYVCMHVSWEGCDTMSISEQSEVGLNSVFPFSYASHLRRWKEKFEY